MSKRKADFGTPENSACTSGRFGRFLRLEMTPVRRKMTQQTSVDFLKNPPTSCSKAWDVLPEMKNYLFQCIENHLKTVYQGISDSQTMPSGCKGVSI